MAKYSSTPFTVAKSATQISEKFSDLTQLQSVIDKLPEAEREKVGDVKLSPDSISVSTKQVGEIKFVVEQNTPEKITMGAQGTPVPLKLDVNLKEIAPEQTEATCSIDLEIPAMLRPMIGPQIQKAVNMLSEVFAKIVQ